MSNNFSERTGELAHHLRCSLRDLAEKIGISQAMLFAYRSGKSDPTLKVLRKLESAERLAGIGAAAEAVVPVVVPPPGRLGEIRAQLASLQAEISTLGDF